MKRLAMACLTTGLVFAGWAAAAPHASAAEGEDCANGYFCIYANGYLTGEHLSVNARYKDLGSFKDKGSSWINKTKYKYCVYDYDQYNGRRKQLDQVMPGEKVKVAPDGTNDRADAVGRC